MFFASAILRQGSTDPESTLLLMLQAREPSPLSSSQSRFCGGASVLRDFCMDLINIHLCSSAWKAWANQYLPVLH